MIQQEVRQSRDFPVLVSVIIPCYNYARYLPDAISSVKAQNHSNWECIIVNDGSTDDTAVVAERLAREDRRITVAHQENLGPSAARNRGLEVARGEYIQFLDADDIITPRKMELQLNLLAGKKQLGLSYSDYRYCDRDNPEETVHRDYFAPPRFKSSRPILDIASRWETEFSIPIHCFLFDSRFFKEHGIRFDETLANHEDWDCWMRIFALEPNIVNIPEQLSIYRIHDESICANWPRMLGGFCIALRKQIKLSNNDPELNTILKKRYREIRRNYWRVIRRQILGKLRTGVSCLYYKNVPMPIQRAVSHLIWFFPGHSRPVERRKG